jgi:hypothetical protein
VRYRVLVTGSRDWRDRSMIEEVLDTLLTEHGQLAIAHGHCPTGADAYADEWARRNRPRAQITRYIANWKLNGRAAGPIRNQHMVDDGADVCLAFIRNHSAGASGCADMARRAGIPVVLREDNEVPQP